MDVELAEATPGGLPHIALTKTIPPSANRLRIERRWLLDLLDRAGSRRLTLIKAPAGYGKTTLAVDWCDHLRRQKAIVAWLSVDEDDNEPSAFAYHLAKTLHRAAPSLAQSAIDLLSETKLIASKNVVSAAINAIAESDDEVFLFLDDYHAVRESRSHELTAYLLRYAPSNFHLAIMSRTEPSLPLSQLRLSDELTEVDVADLRFSLEETEQFLSAELAPRLGSGDISKLHDATEGWPAALQLARITLRNSPDPSKTVDTFSGASRKISSYIEDTLATMADEIVQFLLQSAVLDRLEASLCRTVTGIAQSAELLKALHHEQLLLVTLDEDNGWYRYHHLMSDFLIDRLHARQADQVPELHRRAHRWYSDHRMWNQAVQHAIAARDFDHAFEYVRQCAMPLVIKGDLLTLLAWERQLPPELMSGQIEVKLALVWGLALVTRFSEAETLLEQVEGIAGSDPTSELWLRCRVARSVVLALSDNSGAAYDVASACEDAGSLDPFNLNSVWNVMRYGYWKAGDWDSFYAVPKPDERGDEATYVLAENYRLCLYGMVAAHRLEVDNALQYYGEARALAEKHVGPKSVSAVMVTGLRSLMRYERGDISSAEIAVLDEIDIIDTTVYHESFLSAYLTLVRAAALRDDRPRALMLLNRAERLASDRGWMRLVAILLTERVRLLVMDKADEARLAADQLNAICEQHPAPSRCAWSDIHTFAAVSEGLLMAEAGAFEQAGERLKWAYQELASTNNRHEGLRVGLELSSVLLRAGARTEALEALAQVIGWSTEAGVETYLLERRQEARSLLAVALEEPVANIQLNQEFRRLTDLLGASAAASAKLEEGRGSRQALSAREQSIVGFIANGQSNKQIARTLGVTPETVKTHIKRIFVKLSAETRAQAVVRAQRLGLLHGQS